MSASDAHKTPARATGEDGITQAVQKLKQTLNHGTIMHLNYCMTLLIHYILDMCNDPPLCLGNYKQGCYLFLSIPS